MKRRELLTLLPAGLGLAAAGVHAQSAPELLADISRRLENPAVLRGEFEQTKTIKGFKRPLVSKGTFVMSQPAESISCSIT